jgi:flagellar motility protein MotE (MotC chaperone)
MKERIVYLLIFIFAFALVTGGMFVTNDKYENMFRFDFRDRHALLVEKHMQDSIKIVQDSIRNKMVQDSIARKNNPDSLQAEQAQQLQPPAEAEQAANANGKPDDKKNAFASSVAVPVNAKLKAEKDSIYARKIRQTVQLYETMDAKQVAKVIQTYNDDIAHDIIFAMKKKKAGEILSLLSPDLVHRITKVQ